MVVLLLLLLCYWISSYKTTVATLYLKGSEYIVKEGILDYDNGIMFISYKDSYEEVGWDFVRINSSTRNDLYTDKQFSYAYGYLEGYITHKRIWQYHLVGNAITFQNLTERVPAETIKFLEDQENYVMSQSSSNPYWKQAQETYDFIQGLYDGYKLVAPEDEQFSSIWELYMIASLGDIMDVMNKMPSVQPLLNPELLTTTRTRNSRSTVPSYTNSHCSGIVTYDPSSNDFYFAHVTWAWYNMMVRMFKTVTINFSNPSVHSTTVSFSSYPSSPISGDDFYVTSGGTNLFILETTISCFNESLHKEMTPLSLLTWQRILIANRLSQNGKDWGYYFSLQNSGTYNNEFIILDANLALEKMKLKIDDSKEKKNNVDSSGFPPYTVVVVDQIPKHMYSMDVTAKFVEQGNYFPGYNVPYNKDAFNKCAIPEYIKEHPSQAYMLDYNECVRAKIFRRDHAKVQSVGDMKRLIRYNNYTTDPLSKNNPQYAICARWELLKEDENPSCGGGLDGKVVSVKEWLNNERKLHIISSPTYVDIPVFQFSTAPNKICEGVGAYHENEPDTWNFDWLEIIVEE